MSKIVMPWNRTLQIGLSCAALLLPLWLASAAVANGGGGCEPPPAPAKTNRSK